MPLMTENCILHKWLKNDAVESVGLILLPLFAVVMHAAGVKAK